MRPKTDPKTGKTTVELSTQDRDRLAAAKTAMEEIGWYYRDTRFGGDVADVASIIEEILADGLEVASSKPLPDTKPEPPAD